MLDLTLVSERERYFERLCADIRGARSRVEFEVYIFEQGKAGDAVVESLCAAAGNGVEVRVLVDGVGTPFFPAVYRAAFERAGVAFRVYRQLLWRLWRLLLNRTYWRNHRKLCIVDRRIAWLGSANVSDHDWLELVVRAEGPDVAMLGTTHERAWNDGWSNVSARVGPPFWSAHNWLSRRRLRGRLGKAFRNCRSRIWIMSAYFVPGPRILRRLAALARTGRDVRVLISRESDVFFMPWLARLTYRRLLRGGVKLYELEGGILHSKAFIIDDWALVGTSNLNHRSWLLDLEINVEIREEKIVHQLEDHFEAMVRRSKRIAPPDLDRIPWYTRWLGPVFLRFQRWI